jgi:predicted transcriptional regulator
MKLTMLIRYNIKNVSSAQLREIAENCGRASMVVSPTASNLWNVSICLKEEEIRTIRNLGFSFDKIPG